MKVQNNISLKEFNSFKIDAKADLFINIATINDIIGLLESGLLEEKKYFILGGGSNVLFASDYNGLIINMGIKGMHIMESNDDYIVLEIGAGEDWHNFVKTCVKSQYYGIENLALIPGKVGSAPVQNIGAYGVEQQDCFVSLKAVNLKTKEFMELSKDECRFGYRNSIFKNDLKDNVLITSVRYQLSRLKEFNFSYKELEQEIQKFPVKEIDLQYVFDTVCRLRTSKLPNPDLIGSAGSFFKNPVISDENLENLKSEFPDIKYYKSDSGKWKISAGWLIEKCGWKGKRFGDAGVYEYHALVLVNYGNAKGSDILSLAMKIQDSVFERFGIKIEPEVVIVQ
jgi:UDP-N-acetylmuramate dehydrogenase